MADNRKAVRAMNGRASRAYLNSIKSAASSQQPTSLTAPTATAPKPNPGTDAALAAGCICPVIDNEHGRGYMGQPNVFVYTADCPVHAYVSTDISEPQTP